jgi:hypothetical protein
VEIGPAITTGKLIFYYSIIRKEISTNKLPYNSSGKSLFQQAKIFEAAEKTQPLE